MAPVGFQSNRVEDFYRIAFGNQIGSSIETVQE
jgi:hypothetical protein